MRKNKKKGKQKSGIVDLGVLNDSDGDNDIITYPVTFDPYNLYAYRGSR